MKLIKATKEFVVWILVQKYLTTRDGASILMPLLDVDRTARCPPGIVSQCPDYAQLWPSKSMSLVLIQIKPLIGLSISLWADGLRFRSIPTYGKPDRSAMKRTTDSTRTALSLWPTNLSSACNCFNLVIFNHGSLLLNQDQLPDQHHWHCHTQCYWPS